jgi:NADH-quinone oxidoreductase subunit L
VEFDPIPLVTSIAVALGGLFLGWLTYRGVAQVGQRGGDALQLRDPLARPLGRIYPVLQNKYYFDEFYGKVFVKGVQRLANWLFRFDHVWVIDPIVDGVGKLWRRISDWGQAFDERIVDGVVNGVGAIVATIGSAARIIQTGRAQNYLLVGLVAVAVMLGMFLVLPK